jgi:hypothetical protein
MLKREGQAQRKLPYLLVTGALMAAISATASAQFALPKQGYENTIQVPAKYTPEEAQAVNLVEKWITTMNTHDPAGNMALVDNNIAFRGDPLEPLLRSADGYCGAFGGFTNSKRDSFALEELYAVGGPKDTLVLIKREDINGPATEESGLGGYKVPVAVLLRVTNGKISEWYDAPMNNVSIGALPKLPNGQPPVPLGQQPIPARCMQYANGVPDSVRRAAPAKSNVAPYMTSKAEFYYNVEEEQGAQAVRAWFAARKAGDPLLLGAFADPKVNYRPSPAADLTMGRDNTLKQICGYIGNRLELQDMFALGGSYDTAVLTRWNNYGADGTTSKMASFFRVHNGKIVEVFDSVLDGPDPASASDANSAACQTINNRIAADAAAAARRPRFGGGGGPPPGGAPAGGPPAGGPPGT